MDISRIRNFCIIAHIDHGKSTLADRLLEHTGTISPREMTEQFMDQMDLERERGITIKGKAVKMAYHASDGEYQLNLIDTPGHVDFGYEVSRALTACEGAILVVDAAQGIQAQTLANVYLALEHDISIIPLVNKIDLPVAQPEMVSQELQQAFGFKEDEILFASAKDGTGIEHLLKAIVHRVPPPESDSDSLRALVFDSAYDPYKGVVAYVRLFDGSIGKGSQLLMMATGSKGDILEVGSFLPRLTQMNRLHAGEVGYIATGLKNVKECRVGDTITLAERPTAEPLPGYQPLKSMVFAGLYPSDGDEYLALRSALEKLQLNDAALSYEQETSSALGFGFRCGFLGLLHMEIVQERLEREYGLNLLITAPSVAYQAIMDDGTEIVVDSPAKLPPIQRVVAMKEPLLDLSILAPARFIGTVMELVTARRGEFQRMEYLQGSAPQESENHSPSDARVLLEYRAPLSEVLMDFNDQLKSRTQGYASMDYSFHSYQLAPLVKMDLLVNNQPVDALSLILHRDKAQHQGKALVEKLRTLIPRQLFEVPLQAAVGNRIIARETIRALRKNVLAKCYGGDISRKRKLLEKQAEGKKRMKRVGNVEIPQEAFLALLKLER
ncbi:elongation factor 4 [SAR202 cluster bacterium AC-647-N09_OGT_505m]|nr:elongation factor 4 [SAR202 cluster bacterium AC-647-N09_OGT_505m]